MPEGLQPFTFNPVAVVKSCFKTKFGIPRQPGLVREARGRICFLPPYNQPNCVRGLEDFSHLWLVFVFHEAMREGWKATVRPPRLGGDRRIGVFASRSPFRPAPVGLSVVRLENVILGPHGKVQLEVSGLDLVDGTPVLDVKPYVPYADSIPDAIGGFAPDPPNPNAISVTVSAAAENSFAVLEKRGFPDLRELALRMIGEDPRPAYQKEAGRTYGLFLYDYEIVWTVGEDVQTAEITDVRSARRGQSQE